MGLRPGRHGNIMESKNSVLIVDDEKANLLYLNHILSDDYAVCTARDAENALKLADEYHPDLILLDIIMPGMDGYETLSALKTSDTTRDIPVIFITGLSSNEDEMKGLNLGAEDYITKPFSDAIVKIRVRNQIKIVNQMRAIERLSMLDQLTAIANRRSFNKQMETEWRRAIRDKTTICIMMIDVDRFKVYNDTYGHQQGDVVLQMVAKTLQQALNRPADFVARWGGEEFVVLLPETEKDGAWKIAETLRANIEGMIIPGLDGASTRVTVSIGLNVYTPAQGDTIDAFIFKADKALYTAKETGRNKVCEP